MDEINKEIEKKISIKYRILLIAFVLIVLGLVIYFNLGFVKNINSEDRQSKNIVHIDKDIVWEISRMALNDEKEIGVCLKGYRDNKGDYNITDYYVPNFIYRSEMEIKGININCYLGGIGFLHSHPDVPLGWCDFSRTDIASFSRSPRELDGLVCTYLDNWKFVFVRKSNLEDYMEVEEYD